MWRVLCVDDMPGKAAEVGEFLTTWDSQHGAFEVAVETSFDEAIRRLKTERFDLVTLDLHGASDPDPLKADGEGEAQEGQRVLEALQEARFLPVIFYTGFAEKIAGLRTNLVKVVKKGENDLDQVRQAATEIFATGLPMLVRHIEEEARTFLWKTVDKRQRENGGYDSHDEASYLLARRLAAQFGGDSLKTLLNHKIGDAKPIEYYVYPTQQSTILTGNILEKDGEEIHWIVATPACEFAQERAERVLLLGATELTAHPRHQEWSKTKWKGEGQAPDGGKKALNELLDLVKNRAGERYRFLPGTFFVPNLVVDFQNLRHAPLAEVSAKNVLCQIDSPFREDLLIAMSRYYGRIGTPDLEASDVISRL